MTSKSQVAAHEFLFLLKQYAAFIKENYAPWNQHHVDDIATYLIPSVKAGTVLPIYIGEDIAALYEYWMITPRYLKVLKAMRGEETFPLPSEDDRSGDIMFFPMAIMSKKYGKVTFNITRLLQTKLQNDHPALKGVYRWVLKNRRLRFMKFKNEGTEVESDGTS